MTHKQAWTIAFCATGVIVSAIHIAVLTATGHLTEHADIYYYLEHTFQALLLAYCIKSLVYVVATYVRERR